MDIKNSLSISPNYDSNNLKAFVESSPLKEASRNDSMLSILSFIPLKDYKDK